MKHSARALIISSSPSHPPTNDARRRVRQIVALLQLEGHDTTFLLCPDDATLPEDLSGTLAAMQTACDRFAVVPAGGPPDDGIPDDGEVSPQDRLGRHVHWFTARTRFDVVVVCDPALAGAFRGVPAHALKLLDVAAAPQALAGDAGADIVLVEPGAGLPQAGSALVVALPRCPVLPGPLPCSGPGSMLVAGLTAATADAGWVQGLLDRFAAHAKAFMPKLMLRIGGTVCPALSADSSFIDLAGPVDDPAAFAATLDVAVFPAAPSAGGGLTVEQALGWGRPVVATAEGFAGLPATDPFHTLADADALCMALLTLAFEPARLGELATRSLRAARLASAQMAAAAAGLRGVLRTRQARVVLLADSSFATPGDLLGERASQLAGKLAAMRPLTVVCPDGGARAAERYAPLQYELLTDREAFGAAATPEGLEAALARWSETAGVLHVVLARDVAAPEAYVQAARRRAASVWVDAFALGPAAAALGGAPEADFLGWDATTSAGPVALQTAPLPDLPAALEWTPNPPEGGVVLLFGATDGGTGQWAARRLHRAARAGRVVTDADGPDPARPWHCRPAVVLAPTGEDRTMRLLRCAAGLAGVPFLALDAQPFPTLVQGRDRAWQVNDLGGYLDATLALADQGGFTRRDRREPPDPRWDAIIERMAGHTAPADPVRPAFSA